LGAAYQLNNPSHTKPLISLAQSHLAITAVAGIGNPQRFFDDLAAKGIHVTGIPLADHSTFAPTFFADIPADCILLTEKDAMKCQAILDERIWVVPLSLRIPDTLSVWLQSILERPDPNRYTL